MILLSVVVTAHGVADYLPECLDSLLDEVAPGLEVIAVNDASPDRSGEILAAYAARDARLRVLTNETNVGLGAARNQGLDHASGEYVWFVDGDDWLPPGTVAAVLDRLAAIEPDLLILDYARVFPDGRTEPARVGDLVQGRPLPDAFTLAERPELLRSLHIACNKVVRRRVLQEQGIRFGPGWYEDVSFSLPLVLSSRRIGVLERNSYNYRQRPGASITRSVSDRHFEVFPHWERVFAYLDAHPDLAPLRPLVFARMIWHLIAVLSKEDRLPPGRRRAFFHEISVRYRRYRPAAGYPIDSPSAAIVHRLIRLDAYHLYRAGQRAENGVRAIARAWHRQPDRALG